MSKRFNIAVTVIISLAFLALGAAFWQSYVRFGEACRDFGLSVAYYFCELIGIDYSFTPTVTEYSDVLQWEILLPSDLEGFTVSAGNFFSLLIDGENFAGYWAAVGNHTLKIGAVVCFSGQSSVYVLADDFYSVVFSVSPAIAYLTFDALFPLIVARISSIYYCFHNYFLRTGYHRHHQMSESYMFELCSSLTIP